MGFKMHPFGIFVHDTANTCGSLFKMLSLTFLQVLMCISLSTEEHSDPSSRISATLNRSVQNNGFHRDVVTEYHFHGISDPMQVHLLVIEHLPSGMYADPYELNSRRKFGGPEVFFANEVDVEAPGHKSSSMDVHIFFHNKLISKTVFPVHLRYHKPHECTAKGDYTQVHLKTPSILYRVETNDVKWDTITKPCDSSDTMNCSWTEMKVFSNISKLTFEVPVGCTEHIILVAVITFGVIMTGVIFLCYALIQRSKENAYQRLKTE